MSAAMGQVVVIGAGVGGLTAAATLARQGLRVTVLEAHIYPGGCAGTFYHQGYQFDAGATLAAGFTPGGPMDLVAAAAGVPRWPVRELDLAMVVHLPGLAPIPRWAGHRRWAARRDAFGEDNLPFWHWQEQAADAMWEIALSLLPWPPQGARELRSAIEKLGPWLLRRGRTDLGTLLSLPVDGVSSVARRLRGRSEALHRFVDAQLLIAAQAPARATNALYGAAALDLPRRGAAQAAGGMGALARELSEAVTRQGGEVLYRQRASRVVLEGDRPVAVETERGDSYPADLVVANLPPWSLASLLGDGAPPRLRRAPRSPKDAWGAFTVYMGIDASALGDELALHHQIVGPGLGEGDTVYLSISPGWDAGRAPEGSRALTLSTHTEPLAWWDLYHNDRQAYQARKEAYQDKMIAAAERVIPGLQDAASLVLPGTPLTFARYTSRPLGWVGGYPQTHLLRTQGPRIAPGIWMVGDSVFPGQSVAAVALGGLRVAAGAMAELDLNWEGVLDQAALAEASHAPAASDELSILPERAELQGRQQ